MLHNLSAVTSSVTSVPNNQSSADLFLGFLMQLCTAVCCWSPWWVSNINIKVSDRREAYWFKRSPSCSHNVSTFDLWSISMFSNNTADRGWCRGDGGSAPPWLGGCLVNLPPPQVRFHSTSGLTDMKQHTMNVTTYEVFFSLFFDFLMLLKSQFRRNLWGFLNLRIKLFLKLSCLIQMSNMPVSIN